MAKKSYDNESITSLKGADRVRKRPGVIFGSDGLEGCEHSVFEIISNSIDEAKEGYGNTIEVTRYNDMSIEVKDYGRGIPVDWNTKEEKYNWELVFCELYAGGKYDKGEGENYLYSLGLNGLGLCATQYSAQYMEVTICRDGYEHSLYFEKGENIGGLYKEEKKYRHTGTTIKWRPDLDVFTDINIPLEFFEDSLKRQAVVNPGLTFKLSYHNPSGEVIKKQFYYENGIVDYINEMCPDDEKRLSSTAFYEGERTGRDREDMKDYKVKLSAAFAFSNDVQRIEYYHNSSYLEHGGAPDKAARSAFVSAVDAYIKQNNKYTKNEAKITFNDISDSLILITNCFSTVVSYENQTKKSITNKFIQEAMTDFLRHNIEIFFIENKPEAEKICNQVLLNKRSRETAEKTRTNLKKKLMGSMDVTNRVQKFVDCRTKDISRRELYIVEGDSALGACKLGRDADFQAIIPVRGKILNCLKADFEKIFKSEIITDLLKVMGCGVEIKTKHNKDMNSFDLANLRWNKIIICTDADVDGFQIRTLILTMLYRLVPTLIEEGKVFIAESPLFEIVYKDTSYFAYTEKEKAQILKDLPEKGVSIQRSKGLGENQPDMMWQTTMNPETRRLIQVMPEDALRTAEVFDLLLGDNLQGRKDYIAANGKQYVDLADVM
ncbi:MAG: toprim domain-containing protein [Clostridia bacterium]|nr:toprim domain-containing protein [Clostridia bacterium]